MSQQSNNLKLSLLLVVIALVALLAGYGLRQLLQGEATDTRYSDDASSEKSILGQRRPDFSLPDLMDQTRSIDEWDGKVLLVNFWATWCPPCVREIPAFNQLYESYKDKGFTIIGIALDNKQDVIDFIDPMSVEYPILLGDQQGIKLTQEYGNRLGVLPFSVIIDRQGRIIERHRNEITFEEAEQLIKPLL